MKNIYITFWVKFLDTKSKCNVKDYWKIMFIHVFTYSFLFLTFTIGMLIKFNYGLENLGSFLIKGSFIVSLINFFITLCPNFTITKRRLNDAGLHWVSLFFFFLPYIGPFIIIYFLTLPNKNDEWNFYSK